jgi:hypothetical protein
MHIRLEAKMPGTVSMRRVYPYQLAKENATFFGGAKQFTRNSHLN